MAAKKKNTKSKTEAVVNEEIKDDVNTEETVENTEATDNAESEETSAENTESNQEKTKEQEKIEELEDRIKRQLAEFDNYRKRTDKEKEQMFETGAKSVLEKLLPVVDNFERAIATVKPEDEGNPHAEGMKMIYKQLMTELEKLDVKPIEAVGCEFNPDFHNAIMQAESDEYESGTVLQELQKGYTYRDTVIRHSMVSVVS